jgi:hypothetical protein
MKTVSFKTSGDPEYDICYLAEAIEAGAVLYRDNIVAHLEYIIELIKNRDCDEVGYGAPYTEI